MRLSARRLSSLRMLVALLLLGVAAEAALRAAGWLARQRADERVLRELDLRPGDVSVLCLDSRTTDPGVAPLDAYPKQLENLLRDIYDKPRIRTLAPPDMGQDTSQLADGIDRTLDLYQPRLVIVMAGHGKEPSPAESHRALASLEGLRLLQLARAAWLRLEGRGRSSEQLENPQGAWARPDLVDALLQAARARGIRALRMEDGWHPGPAGHASLARSAFQTIWRNDLLGLAPPAPPPEADAPAWSGGRLALATREADRYLGAGWSAPEAGPVGRYRWTDGHRAEVRIDLTNAERRILRLKLDPFLAPDALPRQRVHLLVNGWPAASLWLAEAETRTHAVAIPERERGGRALLTLLLPDAHAPSQLGLGDDNRRLGVAVEWLSLEDFPGAAPGTRLELGTAAAETYLGAGWAAADEGARWMQAPRAELLFRWEPRQPARLRIRVRALRPRQLTGPPMAVDLNGRRIDPFRVRPTDALPAVYELALPQDLLEERNVLAFEWPGALVDFEEPPGLRVESMELAR